MGWDIDLKDPKTGEPAPVEPFLYGSNVLLGHAIVSEKPDKKGGRRVGLGGELWVRAGSEALAGFIEGWHAAMRENPDRVPVLSFNQDFTLFTRIEGDASTLPAGRELAATGQTQAHVSITFNYGEHFKFEELDGRTGRESYALLVAAVRRLGTERDRDYWKATPGNVGYACDLLAGWATRHPACVWEVRD